MKKLVALMGALLLTLVLAAPAAAGKPEVLYDRAFTWAPYSVAPCEGFEAMYMGEGWESETLYITGEAVKTIYRNRGTDYLYNSVDPSIVFSGKHSFQCHVTVVDDDPLTYFRDCTGTFLNITDPGLGTIAHHAGRIEEYVVGPPGADGDVLKHVGSERYSDDLCELLAE